MDEPGLLDRARPVREGEEIDLAAVDAWLKQHIEGLEGQAELTQYSGGASNWTYRLAYPSHDLILRRPPAGTKAKSAHDMRREYRVQQALAPVFPYVPEMLAFCDDPAIIGCDFYVMRRLEGIIPRANFPRGLELSPAQCRQLCESMIDRLVELHRVDYRAAGLESLGKGSGYVRRQIEGWSDRFAKAGTWNVSDGSRVIDWLKAHMPEDVATCIIHNDYRLDNIVFAVEDPTRIIGILDWEMATLGDPLMDLGNSMAYWLRDEDGFMARQLRRQPSNLPGMMDRGEIVDYYCDRAGLKTDHWLFYEVYGLFRLAVIVQQIYYRYHHRQTRNPAFRHFWLLANYLLFRAGRMIRKGSR